MLDRIKGYPAPRFVRTQGLAALAAFGALLAYAVWLRDPIADLVVWGAVGGVFATIALDAVRLTGVKMRMFPMDMPRMFGLIILGMASAFQANIMAKMVQRLAAEPRERRTALLRERMAFLAQLSPIRRRVMMRGMMKGLAALPADTRLEIQSEQVGVLAELPDASRAALMRTIDELMPTNPRTDSVSLREALAIKTERLRGPRPIPMRAFNEVADAVFRPTLREKGAKMATVLLVGYLYHFVNGASYGIAYTMLFGRGSWTLAFGWGIFVWLVMMIAMPVMMPMIRFPKTFPVVPLLAHLAMAVPIGYFALAYVGPSASEASLVAGLGLGGWLRGLGLL